MGLTQYSFIGTGNEIQDFFPSGEFSQGSLGTCWFLSTTNGLLSTERGRSLLQSLVEQTPEGDFVVHFAQPYGNITVTLEQVENAQGATGDLGVAILEQAWQNLQSNEQNYENTHLEPSRALFGTPERETDYWMSDFSDVVNWYLNNNMPAEHMVFTLHMASDATEFYQLTTTSGDSFSIVPQHEYMMTLQQDENDQITCILENPWYSNRSVEIPFDEIDQYFQVFTLYDSQRLPTSREERDARTIQHSYLTNLVGVDNNHETRPGYAIGSAYTPLDNLWSIAIHNPETLTNGQAHGTDLGDGHTLIIEGNNYRMVREDGSSLFPAAPLDDLLETVLLTREIDPDFLEILSPAEEQPDTPSASDSLLTEASNVQPTLDTPSDADEAEASEDDTAESQRSATDTAPSEQENLEDSNARAEDEIPDTEQADTNEETEPDAPEPEAADELIADAPSDTTSLTSEPESDTDGKPGTGEGEVTELAESPTPETSGIEEQTDELDTSETTTLETESSISPAPEETSNEVDQPETQEADEPDELEIDEPDEMGEPDETPAIESSPAPNLTEPPASGTPLPPPQETKELLAYSMGISLKNEYNNDLLDAIIYGTPIAGYDMPHSGLPGSVEELVERIALVQDNVRNLIFNQNDRFESAKAALAATTLALTPNESIILDNAENISAPTGLPNNREPQSHVLG